MISKSRTRFFEVSDPSVGDDLDILTAWSRTWQMEFNIGKCKTLQVSTHCTKSLFSYQIYSSPLEIVEQHSYLGVYLHHKMSWQPHIDFICNKANRLLGFLYRNLRHCPSNLKQCAYKQLILPTLDYCLPIGLSLLCQHNYEHNGWAKALSIMPA